MEYVLFGDTKIFISKQRKEITCLIWFIDQLPKDTLWMENYGWEEENLMN